MGKLLYATVFVTIVITGSIQKSNADNNSPQCNALAESIVARIEGTVDHSELRWGNSFVINIGELFEATLNTHIPSSIASTEAAIVPFIKSNEAQSPAQAIRNNETTGLELIRNRKVEQFRDTFGDDAYGLATEKANKLVPDTVIFSQKVSRFCTIALRIIHDFKARTVANIQSIEKRTNGNTQACTACTSMATDIFAQLAKAEDSIQFIHLRTLHSAVTRSTEAIRKVYIEISRQKKLVKTDFNHHVDIEFMHSVAVDKIDLYKDVDSNIFKNHFTPRVQQLVSSGGLEWLESLVSADAIVIRRDMANLCNVQLDDYTHIVSETIKNMNTARKELPALPALPKPQ